MSLQTFKECKARITEFTKHSEYRNRNGSGMFVKATILDGKPFCFTWLHNYEYHRLDGPAFMHANDDITEWWFYGELAKVKNQQEFEEWVVRRIMEI